MGGGIGMPIFTPDRVVDGHGIALSMTSTDKGAEISDCGLLHSLEISLSDSDDSSRISSLHSGRGCVQTRSQLYL